MTWDVAVAGTLHRDDITTPRGRTLSFGGSAAYFALAAARHAPVLLAAIVGDDAWSEYRGLFDGLPVDMAGVTVSPRPTFTWHAVHDFERWVTRSEWADAGCDPEWDPDLPSQFREAPVLFLASLAPQKQLSVLERSHARITGADSMAVFLEAEAHAVLEVTRRSDILFLNTAELRLLTGEEDWQRAARQLCARGRPRAVVVKMGPAGAACVTSTAILRHPAEPVDEVVDPTGAGDALAGGFLGHCAALQRDDEEVFATALAEGVRCAADAIASFGPGSLRRAAGGLRPRDV